MIEMINNSIYETGFYRGLEIENTQKNYPLPGVEAVPGSTENSGSDIVEITGKSQEEKAGDSQNSAKNETNKSESKKSNNQSGEAKSPGELSEEEQKEVEELKETDRKVRQHEMAHLAAAQGIAVSGANFEYKRGPDGVNYAVGGDVKIDISKEDDPEKTIEKARKVVAAALAPSDPSPQDRSVASKARQMEAQARMELAKTQQAETGNKQDSQDQQNNTGSTQTNSSSNAENSNQNLTHPGIQTYKQNQAFAPVTANASPLNNNTQYDNIIPLSKFQLDMVA